jgi:hypothetical protein
MSSKLIYSECFKVGDRYAFRTYVGDEVIFTSNEPDPFSLGDYGDYRSPKEAKFASSEMIFRNSPVLTKLAMSDGSSLRTMLVDKYMKTVYFLKGIYDDIVDDYNDESYNNLDRTVPILNKLLDDTAGDGNQLDLVINQMEKSITDKYEPPDDGTVDEQNITSDDSKKIIRMRDWMRGLKKVLENNFPQFITAVSRSELKKTSGSMGIADFINDIAMDYCNKACKSCGMGSPRIESVKDLCGDLGILCRGRKGARAVVVVGTDLTYRGIMPISGKFHHGSMDHFMEMLRPSMNAIGHIRPIGHDFIIVNRQEKSSGYNCFDGYVIGDMEHVIVNVEPLGGKKTKHPSCSYRIDKIRSASTDKCVKNANEISQASMVTIKIPGSEYDGIAGTVDPSKILFRNDHIEFPVSIKYDTGSTVDLWVTDEDVTIHK